MPSENAIILAEDVNSKPICTDSEIEPIKTDFGYITLSLAEDQSDLRVLELFASFVNRLSLLLAPHIFPFYWSYVQGGYLQYATLANNGLIQNLHQINDA